MVNVLQVFLVLLIFLVPLPLSAENGGGRPLVSAIEFVDAEGAEQVVISLSGKVETKIFELPGARPRVVCDLLQTGYPPEMPKVITMPGKLVSRVRVGIHSQPVAKTRVVVDLIEGADYRLEHFLRDEDNSLVLSFAPRLTVESAAAPAVGPQAAPEEGVGFAVEPAAESQAAPATGLDPGGKKSAEPPTEVERSPLGEEAPGETATPAEPAAAEEAAAAAPEVTATAEAESAEAEPEKMEPVGREAQAGPEAIPPTVAEREPALLLDVRFERSTNDKEMVLFKLSGFHPPVIFSAEEDDLLVVCDFLDTISGGKLEPVIETGGKYISRIRISELESPPKMRVVLDLVDRYNYDLKQVFFREDNLFVVIISNLGDREAP